MRTLMKYIVCSINILLLCIKQKLHTVQQRRNLMYFGGFDGMGWVSVVIAMIVVRTAICHQGLVYNLNAMLVFVVLAATQVELQM